MPPLWLERYCGAGAVECARTSAAQALQLLLFATCARRVWRLSALPPRHAPPALGVLFPLHALLAGTAMGLSMAVATRLLLASPPLFPPSLLVTSGLGIVSWGFYAALLCVEQVRHEHSELALLLAIFSAIYGLLGLLYSNDYDDITTAVAAVGATTAAVGVLRQWIHWSTYETTSRTSRDHHQPLLPGSPFDTAGLFSRIAYTWLSPLIALGTRRRFDVADVPVLPARDATDVAARTFHHALERELLTPTPSSPSFLRLARRLYGTDVLRFAAWSTANKLIGLASPLLLKLFLDWAAEPTPALTTGYALAAAMTARSVLAAVSSTQYTLAWQRFDLRVRAGVLSAIYQRTLSLSSTRQYGLGRVTNLVSVDLGRLVGLPSAVFDMVLVPGEIVVALFLLSREVSYAFVAGVAVLGVMLPLQTVLGGKIQSVTKHMLAFRDARVGVAAESLRAIKTLKLLAWLDAHLRTMQRHRELEMGRLAVRKYLDALCVFFWASTPVIVQTAVFAAVVYSGHDVTAANAFTAVSLLDRLIFPMNYFPWIITGFLEARVSALRIRAFLFESEVFVAPRPSPPERADARAETLRTAVEISDCIFTWDQDDSGDGSGREAKDDNNDSAMTPLMQTATLVAPLSTAFELSIEQLSLVQGRDYAVCGPVGAGKSSLLLAILGEMRRQSGHLRVHRRRAAYAPQTPWLFRGSVRQNITMCDDESDGPECAVDEAHYRRVLQACELESDLLAKPQFDRAPVGENGSNLSGGQRLRVNLARALYQRTGLYLLDDPFSGLDATTAARIVTNCFGAGSSSRGQIFPGDATVVLVTHSLHLLELFPRDVEVVVMQDGMVLEHGRYDALVAPGATSMFQSMVADASRQRRYAHSNADSNVVADSNTDATSDLSDSKLGDDITKHQANDADVDDVDEEHREAGGVNLRVWTAYARAVGWPLSVALVLSLVAMQVSRNGLDWWVGVYTNAHHVSPRTFAATLLWIALANCTAVFFRSFLFACGGLRAARSTYARLVTSVFHAALSFFDATPVGRVLNRLSGDTYAIDESLPFLLNIFLKDAADVLGSLGILLYGSRLVLLLLAPLSAVYFQLQRRYRPAARHVRRLDAVAQSPILTMFTETLAGLPVIRAMQLQPAYTTAYSRYLDQSQRMAFVSATVGAWFGIRLDMLGVCVTAFVAVAAVAEFHATGAVNPGLLGLTLTYALPIVAKLNAALGSFVATEQHMIAVERVHEYARLPDETSVVSSGRRHASDAAASVLPTGWPLHGVIEFHGLTVTYPIAGSPSTRTCVTTALSDVQCRLAAGEKVGVCGRTGAGKSTFLNALFRAVTWRSGRVEVDGVDLETLSLRELRTRLTYIPQDIVLFNGTIRSNLDPDNHFEDHELWAALAKCGLERVVAQRARGLEAPVEAGDATLSKGQSQLLGVARALLRPSRVLCVDEATASVDVATEQLVAKTLATEFAGSTVVIVAHRVQTIMHCERILVFESGRLAESGPPHALADDPTSLFHALVTSSSSSSDGQSELPGGVVG